MASSDVCLAEDAVKAFLEHLVDPLLPEKSSVRDNPAPPQHQLIAKQVHSVVLLYNYYHRKQHPELDYLPFNEFCKLAVVQRPPLLAYMQFMQKLNEEELIDVEKQLSFTEKMIMDACDVSKCLDASKNVPNIEGWPISKVAILLIDSKMEYCFLLHGSGTRGVWSVVENSLDTSSQSAGVTSETLHTCKRKRVIRKPTKDEVKVDESGLLQAGYSAIKEATGINNTDITLLESYTVYSQSKEKAASRFYIMQCSQSISQEVIQVPLKGVIESLQGPLVKKSSSSWTITPVVDYFHVLPYSEIISKWISRGAFSNSLQDSRVETNIMVDSPEVITSDVSKHAFTGLGSKPSKDYIESLEHKENKGSCTLRLSDSIKEPNEMDVDKSLIYPSENKEKCKGITNTIQIGEGQEKNNLSVQYNSNGSASAVQEPNEMDVDKSSIYPSENKEKCKSITSTIQIGEGQEKNNLSVQYNSNGSASAVQAVKVESIRMLINEDGINNIASCSKLCANKPNTSFEKDTIHACTQSSNYNSDLEKLQIRRDSEKTLSRTALSALIRKRNELALQQRKIGDEIAICDKKIERMVTDGEDELELKIDSVIESCNDIWTKNQERMCGQQSFPLKRKNLSEADITTQSPCQKVAGVCHENKWDIPTYHLSQTSGGFHANVTVKGGEFQCTFEGNVCYTPHEARETAAAKMLTILRSMPKSAK